MRNREKRKEFFNALISKKMSLSQIVEQEKELGINMVASVFCIILFQFRMHEDMYEYSNEIVQCEIKMMDILGKYSNVKVFERDIDGWAFILLGEDEKQIRDLTDELCNLLIRICDNKVHYFGGIGRPVHRIRDLQQSYRDANSAFSLRYFDITDQFLSYNDVRDIKAQIVNRVNVSEMNLENLDREAVGGFLKEGTVNDIDEFVDSYFDGFGTKAMNSALFRQYIIMDVYSVITKFLKSLNCPKEKTDGFIKSMNIASEQLY